MELAQLVANRVEDASRPLHEEVVGLKLLLARVGVSLEPTTSGEKEFAPVQVSFPLDSVEMKSSVVEITPELHELSGDSSLVSKLLELSGDVVMPPSIEEVRFDPHEILAAPSPPSWAPCFEKDGVVVALSRESDMHVVPFGVGVAKSRLLAAVTGAVVAREVYDFLAALVVAYPGSIVG
jgi:hypothetical protein